MDNAWFLRVMESVYQDMGERCGEECDGCQCMDACTYFCNVIAIYRDRLRKRDRNESDG